MDVGASFRKLRTSMLGIVRRGVLRSISNDLTAQIATVADRVADRVERFEQYGFASNPASGAECLVFQVGADPSHQVAIAVGDRASRPELDDTEVAVFGPNGSIIRVLNDGSIEITPAPGQRVTLGGDATVTTHVALAELVRTYIQGVINSGVPAAGDGGAALRTTMLAFITATQADTMAAARVYGSET